MPLLTYYSYICEISPPSKRGPLTSCPQLFITFGLLIGYFICYGTTNMGSSMSWRLPFTVLAALAFAFSVAALRLTPSPRWLTLHGRTAEAAVTWDILGVSHAEREKVEIQEHIRDTTEEQGLNSTEMTSLPNADGPRQQKKLKGTFRELFSPEVRARTFLAAFMMAMQQLSGIDGVLYVRIHSNPFNS
jgi:MFS family permease